MKSRTAAPSRRNSGLETTDTSGEPPICGSTRSSQVPGYTVLRTATTSGLSRPGSDSAISWATRRNWSRSRLPFFSEGVPTQISATSAAARGAPPVRGGGPRGNERDAGRGERFAQGDGSGETAGSHAIADQLFETGFEERGAPGTNGVHLELIAAHTHHAMTDRKSTRLNSS